MFKSFLFFLSIVVLISATVNISNADNQSKKKDYVRIVYFHGDFRCHTCTQIENYIKESVKTQLDKEVKAGNAVFETINFDKKKNKHYLDKYNLYNQALIIMRYENGKVKEWKNCEDIWELVGNKGKFIEYVTKEVKNYLKAG